MKGNKIFKGIGLILALWIGNCTLAQAQNGDQILDGIGETGLIARYVLDGDAKDWSRNNLHAKIEGTEASFITDDQFGNVLALSATGKNYITIPPEALAGIESLSVTGWIYLQSSKSGQGFFDFGKNSNSHFFVSPTGTAEENSFLARLSEGKNKSYKAVSKAVNTNEWVHIAVAIDIPSKSMSTYINGKRVGETKNIELELESVFGKDSDGKNAFYIGKLRDGKDTYLDAKLHDFRIYRIPLGERQIAGIYQSALKNEESVVNESKKTEDNLPQFPASNPQLYNPYLKSVKDVAVATVVGDLPRLPRYIDGVYDNKVNGPKVRVLWPAPIDNTTVRKPGSYTVTGHIAGTDFKPKATVTVKDVEEAATPVRKLEGFTLDQVSLSPDSHGHATKFMENRDKFISTLAETNPDSFLYMFRDAFGQPQPDGATALGVWDSQETKLRGHATGHYMTAIAQAYASTSYDKTLQANFSAKMDYMVNSLYTLSQMSGKPKESGGEYVADPTAVPSGAGRSGYDSDLSEAGIRTDYWNWGEGFISAYAPDQFIMLENGAKYGGQKDQVWAPYYTLHKIMAGLLDIYEVNGDQKALEIVT